MHIKNENLASKVMGRRIIFIEKLVQIKYEKMIVR